MFEVFEVLEVDEVLAAEPLSAGAAVPASPLVLALPLGWLMLPELLPVAEPVVSVEVEPAVPPVWLVEELEAPGV